VNTRRALAIIAASAPNGLAAESLGHADVRETTLQRSAAQCLGERPQRPRPLAVAPHAFELVEGGHGGAVIGLGLGGRHGRAQLAGLFGPQECERQRHHDLGRDGCRPYAGAAPSGAGSAASTASTILGFTCTYGPALVTVHSRAACGCLARSALVSTCDRRPILTVATQRVPWCSPAPRSAI
jgi:hypothetical protein